MHFNLLNSPVSKKLTEILGYTSNLYQVGEGVIQWAQGFNITSLEYITTVSQSDCIRLLDPYCEVINIDPEFPTALHVILNLGEEKYKFTLYCQTTLNFYRSEQTYTKETIALYCLFDITIDDSLNGLEAIENNQLILVNDNFVYENIGAESILKLILEAIGEKCEVNSKLYEKAYAKARDISLSEVDKFKKYLVKMLVSSSPDMCLQTLDSWGILDIFIPELSTVTMRSSFKKYPDNVWNHTLRVVKNLKVFEDVKYKHALPLAALFHDLTYREDTNPIYTPIDLKPHEESSYQLATEIMKRLGFSVALTKQVANLIKYHHYELNGNIEKASFIVNELSEEELKLLIELQKVDFSHSSNADPRFIDNLKLFIKLYKSKNFKQNFTNGKIY